MVAWETLEYVHKENVLFWIHSVAFYETRSWILRYLAHATLFPQQAHGFISFSKLLWTCFYFPSIWLRLLLFSVLLSENIALMHANQSSLKMLDSVYHASLRFGTKSSFRTHHCSLYESVGWLSLHNRRLEHWYIFLFKDILYKLPSYLCSLLTLKVTTSKCNLRSCGQIMYDIPRTRTVFGESAFKVFAPLSWYKLQNHLKLDYLPTMTQFRIKDYLSTKCTCAITERCW